MRRPACVAAALSLIAGVLVASAGGADAATSVCLTGVTGVGPDGRLVDRVVRNTTITAERRSAAPLSFAIDDMVWTRFADTAGQYVVHYNTFAAGQKPREVSVKHPPSSDTVSADVLKTYRSAFSPRLVAGSSSAYVYGVDAGGNLKRWTRKRDSAGNLYFDSAKLVASNMGGLKTLGWSWTYQVGGVATDFLYATTKTGGLKQIRVPRSQPASRKIVSLRTTGFGSYTELSLSFCNNSGNYFSMVAIDSNGNKARLFSMAGVLTSTRPTLVDRGPVAVGAEWRLHGVV